MRPARSPAPDWTGLMMGHPEDAAAAWVLEAAAHDPGGFPETNSPAPSLSAPGDHPSLNPGVAKFHSPTSAPQMPDNATIYQHYR